MNELSFMFGFLCLISIDIIIGIIVYIFYKYIDLKYFSKLKIIELQEENNYLKNENKKINGISTNFWSDK